MKHFRYWLLCLLFLILALMLLRLQWAEDLGLSFSQAWSMRISIGWLYDVVLSLLVVAITLLALIFGQRSLGVAIFALLALLAWLGTLFNGLYFKFFGTIAHAWVIQLHWQDTLQVRGSAQSLAASGLILLSLLSVVLAVFLLWKAMGSKSKLSPLQSSATALGLLLLALLLRQSPVWWGSVEKAQDQGNILTQLIFKVWWDETIAHPQRHAQQKNIYALNADRKSMLSPLLQWSQKNAMPYRFESRSQEQQVLLKKFGLPAAGPWHVVILFLESFRNYEFNHPFIGPDNFPEIRAEMHQRGWYFAQTYSSSIDAGQTVRGQFSTLCSMLPNLLGPATYLAHYQLRLSCLPSVLAAAGYQTLWVNSHDKHFHNKEMFERLHGTEKFYDRQYFWQQGIRESIGDWGLADKPVLQETVKILNRHAQDQPVFAHVLTVGTHHPFTEVAEAPVSGKLRKWVEERMPAGRDRQTYLGYLSRQRYADHAAGLFLRELFNSPMGERTLVAVLGDHGSKLKAADLQNFHQASELPFRVPLIFLSKNMTAPQRSESPAQQWDVAPTLARVLGIESDVTWQGRPLLTANGSQAGSDWLYVRENALSYREKERVCYSQLGKRNLRCFVVSDNASTDPLYASQLKEVTENPEHSKFLQQVVKSNSWLISRDLIMPDRSASK